MIENQLPERERDGRLPAYAWPGGYPIAYLFFDGGVCCARCANGANGSDAYTPGLAGPDSDPQWLLEGWFIHWEGPDEHCEHCGDAIASAYGDPNTEDEQ